MVHEDNTNRAKKIPRVAFLASRYGSGLPSGENIFVDQAKHALGNSSKFSFKFFEIEDSAMSNMYKVRTFLRVASGYGRNPLSELRQFQPDIVIISNLFPNWSIKWIDKLQIPIVSWVHNFRMVCANGNLSRNGRPCSLCPSSGKFHAIKYRCYRNSFMGSLAVSMSMTSDPSRHPLAQKSVFLVATSEIQAQTLRTLGVPEHKITVIENYSTYSQISRSASRSYWLWIGRLSAEKIPEQVFSNWPKNSTLKVVGDGPLKSHLEALNFGGIDFLGQLPRNDISALLRHAKGLIFSSSAIEGAAMVYQESMAHGVPVIANSGNSVSQLIRRDGSGVVVSDWQDLPEALVVVDRNNSTLSANAYRASELMSEGIWLDNVERLCEEIMTQTSQGHRDASR